MKIKNIYEPQIIMNNPKSLHNFFAWPTVSRLQNGKIAVVASGYRLAHVCPFGKTVISYSEDEGKSYTRPAPVIDTVLDDRDGGIMAYGEKNVIVTSFTIPSAMQKRDCPQLVKPEQIDYCMNYLKLINSDEEERVLGANFRISNDCGVSFGEIFKSPVSSPHGPVEIADGTVLWIGNVGSNPKVQEIKDHKERQVLEREGNRIEVHKILPDGTCEYVSDMPAVYEDGLKYLSFEPHAIYLDDGTVLCHLRVQKDFDAKECFTIYQTESKDCGKTWTTPHRVLDIKGGAPAHLMKHSSGMLISTYGFREAPYGIKAMFSCDNGQTWDIDNDIYINGLNSDLGYPSTVELKDRSLLTVFYARESENGPAVIMQKKWRFEE